MSKLTALKGRVAAAACVAASFTAPMAMASTESEAAMDSILAEATALLGKAWLIVVPLTVGFIGMKLFRKAGNKST